VEESYNVSGLNVHEAFYNAIKEMYHFNGPPDYTYTAPIFAMEDSFTK